MITEKTILFPPYYEALSSEYPDFVLGRIVLQEKGLYNIITVSGYRQPAEVSGKFRFDVSVPSDYPAVGDYVMVDINGDHEFDVLAVDFNDNGKLDDNE